MSRTRLIAVSVSLALALTVSARDSRKELSVDLKFAPQEGVASNSPDLTPSVMEKAIAIHVEDARGGDAAVIGQGTNDDDAAFSIRASSDVVAFVADSAKQVADGWGVKVADSADRVLTLRLMRYFVDESNKALGSVYAAEVKVAYVLSDKSGKKLMEGSTSGSAHLSRRGSSLIARSSLETAHRYNPVQCTLPSCSARSNWRSAVAIPSVRIRWSDA
jgi:hypothetical protein